MRKPMKFTYKDVQKLASELAKAEGGRSQVKIGDIREVLKLLATAMSENMWVTWVMCAYATQMEVKKMKKEYLDHIKASR